MARARRTKSEKRTLLFLDIPLGLRLRRPPATTSPALAKISSSSVPGSGTKVGRPCPSVNAIVNVLKTGRMFPSRDT
jgi:hypothetical protein